MLMSPTQNEGPRPLGNNDVERMRQSLDANARNSMLAYPALSMMQSGREGSDGHDMFDGAQLERKRPTEARMPTSTTSTTRPLFRPRPVWRLLPTLHRPTRP